MIVGDPDVFALESGISVAYPDLAQRGLGFFLIHVGGFCFGVRAPEATMLACSFDEVRRRLRERGRHSAPFAGGADAGCLASAVRRALYFDVPQAEMFFGRSRSDFADYVYEKDLLWAPDGDEAFDDGSYVLQLDLDDQVRLIGFVARTRPLRAGQPARGRAAFRDLRSGSPSGPACGVAGSRRSSRSPSRPGTSRGRGRSPPARSRSSWRSCSPTGPRESPSSSPPRPAGASRSSPFAATWARDSPRCCSAAPSGRPASAPCPS